MPPDETSSADKAALRRIVQSLEGDELLRYYGARNTRRNLTRTQIDFCKRARCIEAYREKRRGGCAGEMFYRRERRESVVAA